MSFPGKGFFKLNPNYEKTVRIIPFVVMEVLFLNKILSGTAFKEAFFKATIRVLSKNMSCLFNTFRKSLKDYNISTSKKFSY